MFIITIFPLIMISQFFISRPTFAVVISIVIVITGIIAIYTLPVTEYPEIAPPAVTVQAAYPGANADIVEKTVLVPLEAEINGVERMMYMSSTASNDGTASITVTFENGTDHSINTVNVQNRVSKAMSKLPYEVTKQGIDVKARSTDMLSVINVYSPNNKYDGLFLSNFTSLNIRDVMLRISGVGDAVIMGGEDYAMRIWLYPDKLTAWNISVDEVLSAINEQNVQVAAGQIGAEPAYSKQQFQYTILAKGRLADEKEFGDIIIREKPDGGTITLKDVAKIELGAYSYSSFGELNKKPCALLAIFQLPGSNALEIDKKVRDELNKLSRDFPEGIEARIIYDTTDYVKASIDEVIFTLMTAVLLVILVTYMFLQDWRAVFIPAIAVPVSLIGTFAVLLAVGYTINTITLFGLILATGIVVDDAIIVIENVNRLMREEGLAPVEATRKSMNQVTSPIIATTLVLMAMFVPVAFIPGITGVLYRQFGVTVSVSVGISAINALTLSPALCATILKKHRESKFKGFMLFNMSFDFIKSIYRRIVSFTLKKPVLISSFMALLIGALYILYETTPSGFMPDEDQGVVMLNVQLPDGASLKRTTEVLHWLNDKLQTIPGVKDILSVVGYSMLSGSSSSNCGMSIIVLKPWDQRKSPDQTSQSIAEKANKMAMAMPEGNIFAFVRPPIRGLGTTGGFEYVLQDTTGNNPRRIYDTMNLVTQSAIQTPQIELAYSVYRPFVPHIYLDIDRPKVKKLGLHLSDVFTTLQAYLGSIYINDFNRFGKVYKVYIQAITDYRDDEKDILNLYVKNDQGNMVPMNTILSIRKILAPEIIYHYNMFPSATINGAASEGFSSGDAIRTMEDLSSQMLPKGMTYSWTGTAYQEILAGNKVVYIFILSVLFIYLFLVAQYNSWALAMSVMFSIPVGFLGAVAATRISGLVNNIYAQIGFVLVFGLASKTAILIVEFAKRQREEGRSVIEAAEIASGIRFRAVIMTISAFVFGVLPLVIATGAGAESRKSLGTAIFGGTLLAGILGTILIPSFYSIIQKIKEKIQNRNDQHG